MTYALASRSVKLLRPALGILLTGACIALAFYSKDVWQAMVCVETGIVAIVAAYWFTQKLNDYVERRYAGEAQHPERILSELGHAIAGVRDTRALIDIVAPRLNAALHADPIHILIDCGDRFEVCSGAKQKALQAAVEKRSATMKHLQRLQSPARVDRNDSQSWIFGLPEAERETILLLDARILVPMTVDRRIVGLLSAGPKRWDMPYSRADLQFLTAAASQTGLALENARLNDDIRAEIAARERLNRELEIARDVQQRLFPQVLPRVPHTEIAGYCRPASGVGGDYYDFLSLEGSALGIAIGDVAGKGIGAALTMATLQASLRGQTIRPCETLAEMMQNVNKLIYEASASNRYATFFYAQYEPDARRLKYVNAGHNPPILMRSDGSVVRLRDGGIVIGLFPGAAYSEASIDLQPGDLLITFTDGITEAMNTREDEFGEDRLIEILRATRDLPIPELISGLLSRVDAFVAGAPQHDDMTLAAARFH